MKLISLSTVLLELASAQSKLEMLISLATEESRKRENSRDWIQHYAHYSGKKEAFREAIVELKRAADCLKRESQ